MEKTAFYLVTVDGVPYHVQITLNETAPLSGSRPANGIIEPPAQAPWVTTQRVAHLPPR